MKHRTLKQIKNDISDLKHSLDNIELFEPDHEYKALIIDEYLSELHSLYLEYELARGYRMNLFMVIGFTVLVVSTIVAYILIN